MSLRRSARNAGKDKAGAPVVTEALYLKTGINGSSKDLPAASTTRGTGAAPSRGLPASLAAGNKATAAGGAKTAKSGPKPKKVTEPRKRKAPSASKTEALGSTAVLSNGTTHSDFISSTGTPPELLNEAPSEVLQTNDTTSQPSILDTQDPLKGPDRVPTAAHLPPPDPAARTNPPSTPVPAKRSRRTNPSDPSPAKPVPFTPTPSGVGLIAGPANVPKAQDGHVLDDLARLNQTRPAEPRATNAPVLTPGGDAVVVNDSPSKNKKRKVGDLPPDVGSPLKVGRSTVDTLLKEAEAYLIKVDAEVSGKGRLERLIATQHCKMFSPEGLSEVVDPFTALASGIIGQQVSGAAASSIRAKFTALFPTTHPAFPTPTLVLTKDLPTLRSAGLSQRKAEYISGLAEKFASGEFTASGLVSANDEELIEKLVAVRGLGRWSVEMFACFGLKRMDVFSTGDLGVQRGMAAYMGRDVSKLKNKGGKWKYMSEQEMLSIASKFSPYRSLFMWYMWRIADVETEVLE